jgi:dTDP-4-dehydrorhamnose reductase
MSPDASTLIVGDRGMLAHAIRQTLQSRGVEPLGVDVDRCDITRPEQVAACFDEIKPSLVINCAAYTNVDGCEKNVELANAVNGTGVGHLAHACRARGTTLVHFSTDYVFDGSLRRPLRPDDPVGPRSAYGKSKLLGEQLLQQHAPARWLIIRTAWLYGPNGPSFPQTMLNAARAGKPLRVVADQVGSPTFTFDLASAVFDLLDRDAAGIFHVTNSGETSWFDFAKAIFSEFGVTPTSLDSIDSAEWKRIKPDSAERPAYSVLDLSAYERVTGQTMPSWQDALRRYHDLVEPRS